MGRLPSAPSAPAHAGTWSCAGEAQGVIRLLEPRPLLIGETVVLRTGGHGVWVVGGDAEADHRVEHDQLERFVGPRHRVCHRVPQRWVPPARRVCRVGDLRSDVAPVVVVTGGGVEWDREIRAVVHPLERARESPRVIAAVDAGHVKVVAEHQSKGGMQMSGDGLHAGGSGALALIVHAPVAHREEVQIRRGGRQQRRDRREHVSYARRA